MARLVWLIATSVAVLGVTASSFFHPLPSLIWNASTSAPIGLYLVRPAASLDIAELVVVQPPNALARFLASRQYLPEATPMLKRGILALPGQIVCRDARTITVDGIAMGEALERDTRGRPLPIWQGRQRIREGQIFLMNSQSNASFDGRYFGPLHAASIIDRADPLLTGED
jgi:conjugative transfer signal peptidase TraF